MEYVDICKSEHSDDRRNLVSDLTKFAYSARASKLINPSAVVIFNVLSKLSISQHDITMYQTSKNDSQKQGILGPVPDLCF